MIQSMTGFGRKDFENEDYKIAVEIKTVNHKYLNIYTKFPSRLNSIEEKIKKYINKSLKRGRIEVSIYLTEKSDEMLTLTPNFVVLDEYVKALTEIQKRYNIKADVNLEQISQYKDAIITDYQEIDEDKIWKVLKEILDEVIESVLKMRTVEGKKLKEDIVNNLDAINTTLIDLSEISDGIVDKYRDSMKEKINDILEDIEVDNERLEQEIAIYADKKDINEEITRIHSHLEQFNKIFDSNEPIGRKLDFLAQELNREINTIGSKSPDVNISTYVVDLKSYVGQIREQILNVE